MKRAEQMCTRDGIYHNITKLARINIETLQMEVAGRIEIRGADTVLLKWGAAMLGPYEEQSVMADAVAGKRAIAWQHK